MITCQLQGGLGNQMFQIAATYALAKRNDDEYCFNFEKCHTPLQGNPSTKYKESILKNVNENRTYEPKVFYKENSFGYVELPHAKDLCLVGYFQSEKYFIDCKNDILNLFNVSTKDILTIRDFFTFWGVLDKKITSVHIRRGDYLKNPEFHQPCSIEYYQKAIEEIGDSYFIFISDDMDWVKENFKNKDYIYSTLNDEILDFTLMTHCDNNIIANSSFSWWGAYLNKNKNKKVIAPKEWFGPNGPKETQDLIPNNWLIL